MKKLFTFLFWLGLLNPAIAQAPKFTFKETVSFGQMTPDEVSTCAWRWFNQNDKASPGTAEINNRQSGKFSGTSALRFVSTIPSGNDFTRGTIYYSLKLTINDDRTYTYELSDFTHQARTSFNLITTDANYPYRITADRTWHNQVWNDIKSQINSAMEPLITDLKTAMQKNSRTASK
jgi:hypothetical protein